jgi:excisionase family DNA binding protein
MARMETQIVLDWTDLLTTTEVARLLRVNAQTVHRWIQRGKLAAARRHGRYLVPRKAALALLEMVEPEKEVRPAFYDAQVRARLARHGL